MTHDNQNDDNDKSDGVDDVHGEVAPKTDAGDAKGGEASAAGGAGETAIFEIFTGIGFDRHFVGDGVGELAGLFVVGIGEFFVDVASFIISDDGDGTIHDGVDN